MGESCWGSSAALGECSTARFVIRVGVARSPGAVSIRALARSRKYQDGGAKLQIKIKKEERGEWRKVWADDGPAQGI